MSVKIIKYGNLKNTTYRFNCSKCGCIFEVDGNDVVTDLSRNVNGDTWLTVFDYKCPCCGRFVTGVEVDEWPISKI